MNIARGTFAVANGLYGLICCHQVLQSLYQHTLTGNSSINSLSYASDTLKSYANDLAQKMSLAGKKIDLIKYNPNSTPSKGPFYRCNGNALFGRVTIYLKNQNDENFDKFMIAYHLAGAKGNYNLHEWLIPMAVSFIATAILFPISPIFSYIGGIFTLLLTQNYIQLKIIERQTKEALSHSTQEVQEAAKAKFNEIKNQFPYSLQIEKIIQLIEKSLEKK